MKIRLVEVGVEITIHNIVIPSIWLFELLESIGAILEYTKVLFNKGVFFAILKKKYYNYNNNYTKYT